MGWVTEDGQHEGHAAYVAPDGRTTGTSSSAGVFIRRRDADQAVSAAWGQGRPPRDDEIHDLVAWDDVKGWQVACECGWTGSTWDRAATLLGDDGPYADANNAYLPDGTTVDAAAYAEWEQHVGPVRALTELENAAAAAAAARRRLDEAATAARTAGATWADIGRATGFTRQSAHERWSRTRGASQS